MKYVSEYRDEAIVQDYIKAIASLITQPWTLMEKGIYRCLQQLETSRTEVENQYARAVSSEGNQLAQQLVHKVFQIVPRLWRGLGSLDDSGLALQKAYALMDAQLRFADWLQLAQQSFAC